MDFKVTEQEKPTEKIWISTIQALKKKKKKKIILFEFYYSNKQHAELFTKDS